ncbi:MAG: hypothetical protein RIF33_07505 [Cyclobacteriaceae bacterium]
MKQILIISYHSLPFDTIASYRANAYLRHLNKFGLRPTLVTHPWTGLEKSNQYKEEEYEYGRVTRVPIKTSIWGRVIEWLEQIPIINKLAILLRWSIGFLDNGNRENYDSYQSLKKYLFAHLKKIEYDYCMGIFSPHHHLKLCYEINQKFGIPYMLDFRDLWDNRVIHREYNPSLRERLQDSLTKYHWKKWLSNALFFSITSEPWRDKINEFSDTKGIIVTNGYDPEGFEVAPRLNPNEFRILYAGRLYAHQRLDIFLKGCQLFLDRVEPANFKLRFYGSSRSGLSNRISGFLYQPEALIAQYLGSDYYLFEKRIPKKELIACTKGSQVLLFPGMPDATGTHLGKIFDYLASGVNILLTPDDNDVVGELIRETKTGQIANTPKEVCTQLSEWYKEWEKTGEVKWQGNRVEINKYSRESQVKRFTKQISLTS